VGVVNTDVLNFRSGPGTGYGIIGQLYKGQIVRIIEYCDSEWSKVTYNSKDGFVATRYLTIRSEELTSRSLTAQGVSIDREGYVTANLNFRTSPSFEQNVISVIPMNSQITILEDCGGGWGKIQWGEQAGYASLEYIALGQAPEPVYQNKADEIIEYAKKFLGKPYAYGGNGPNSFDCSGFTKYIFSNYGIALPRVASSQATTGYYVSKGELARGDIVCFKQSRSRAVDHVGIYIGDGQFIHSSSPGDVVKIDSINSGYYNNYYYTARRVL